MRTIAISDIHGCYNELKEMILALEEGGVYNKDTDKLVFLGDYIDRGNDSRLVIEFIRNLQKDNDNVIALMGNHEDMMLDYYYCNGINWKYNGYETTLDSYKGFNEQLNNDIEWMLNLPLYHEDEHFIYVHAGIDMNKPMEEQDRYTLLWVRDEFIYNGKEYGKKVIFGHTPTPFLNEGYKPVQTYNGNVDIDTGCVYGGALTALVIEDGEIVGFHQVDKEIEHEYEEETGYEQMKIDM